MSSLDNLLVPSLSNARIMRPLYSAQSHFFVAFFGGPLSLCLFGWYSVNQAGVLSRYRTWYVALFTVSILILGFWVWTSTNGFPIELDEQIQEADIRKWGNRLAGLAMMGGIYLIQQSLFLVSKMKADTPSPWIPGILSVVAGSVLNVIILFGWAYVI